MFCFTIIVLSQQTFFILIFVVISLMLSYYFFLLHTCTLSRARSCAFFTDLATSRELKEVFTYFDTNDTLKAAVFTGSGGNFCAGYDLQFLADSDTDNIPEMRATHRLHNGPMGPTHMQLTKPVIAAVEGYAVAGK